MQRFVRESYTVDVPEGWFTTEPAEDPYTDTLALSGPPGGPQMFRVEPIAGNSPLDVKMKLSELMRVSIELGPEERVVFAMEERVAHAAVLGQSLARTGLCTLVLPTRGGRYILVCLGVGHSTKGLPTCKALLKVEVLAKIARGFVLK